MKRKKQIRLLIMLFLIMLTLCVTVSGTIAWIVTKSNEKKNVFEPGKIDTVIEEIFDNNKEKKSVVIKNEGTIPVYVRVAVIANWYENSTGTDGETEAIVEPWTGSIKPGTDWIQINDYYYYTKPVPAGGKTSNLLSKSISATSVNGTHLEMTILHQSVQAEPTSVVQDEWNITVDEEGKIIG